MSHGLVPPVFKITTSYRTINRPDINARESRERRRNTSWYTVTARQADYLLLVDVPAAR